MRAGLLAASAVLAALLASLCCIGPLVLAGLGISSLGLTTTFAPYRLWLIGVAVVLLVGGFYVAHRKSACCEADSRRRRVNLALWVVLLLAIALLALAPRILALRQRDARRSPPNAGVNIGVPNRARQLPTCPACSPGVSSRTRK